MIVVARKKQKTGQIAGIAQRQPPTGRRGPH
jgi:hypothetical protein